MAAILNIQLIWGLLSRFLPWRSTGIVQIPVASINLLLSLFLISRVVAEQTVFEWNDYLFLDSLSAVILLITSSLSFLVSIYSVGYIESETRNGLSEKRAKDYYFWLNMFVFAMLAVTFSHNLGILWIAVEGTTLTTAFLISFYQNKEAIEAGWKYIILCSVGIAFALFGIIILYFSVHGVLGEGGRALHWSNIMAVADQMDGLLLKIAFIFIFVGFGTKVGLAPLHFWLPDAHSQAPTPISALMSGVLLSCAFYSILRVAAILNLAGLGGFACSLFLFFGLFTIFISTIFTLKQLDYKRLLAYSSMEHMGIVAVAFGINSRAGVFAGIFHLVNHSIIKGLLFFSAGSVLTRYHTRNIFEIKGLLKTMPLTGGILLLGVLAITGMPPFNIFASKFLIVIAGFERGLMWQMILMISFLVIIFGGIIWHFLWMLMGSPESIEEKPENASMLIPMILTLSAGLALGFHIPETVYILMNKIPEIIGVNT